MSALKEHLKQATKDAMRARDKERVGTLRMVNAEVKRVEVDDRRELSDDDLRPPVADLDVPRRDLKVLLGCCEEARR